MCLQAEAGPCSKSVSINIKQSRPGFTCEENVPCWGLSLVLALGEEMTYEMSLIGVHRERGLGKNGMRTCAVAKGGSYT